VDAFDDNLVRHALLKYAAIEDEESDDRLGPQAPVTPGELAMAGGMSIGVPWVISRATASPMSLGEAAKWSVTPKGTGAMIFNDILGTGLGAFNEPGYRSGQQGFLSATGSAFGRQVRGIGQASREARERYGLLGVPLQALHGIWNPLSSTAYMLKSMRDSVFDKAGAAARDAQVAVRKSFKEM
jgi:hypothetical protein